MTSKIPNDEQQISDYIVGTLRKYYDSPPSERILKYLRLYFLDFKDLKKNYPLKINVKFYNDIGGGRDSIDAGYIYAEFGQGTKKNYIVSLAYEEDYFDFYSDEDRKKLNAYYNGFNEGEEEKIDAVNRVDVLRFITKKTSGFPFNDLVYSLGLFSDS